MNTKITLIAAGLALGATFAAVPAFAQQGPQPIYTYRVGMPANDGGMSWTLGGGGRPVPDTYVPRHARSYGRPAVPQYGRAANDGGAPIN